MFNPCLICFEPVLSAVVPLFNSFAPFANSFEPFNNSPVPSYKPFVPASNFVAPSFKLPTPFAISSNPTPSSFIPVVILAPTCAFKVFNPAFTPFSLLFIASIPAYSCFDAVSIAVLIDFSNTDVSIFVIISLI